MARPPMSMYLARMVPVDQAHTAMPAPISPRQQVLRLRRSGARRVGGGCGHAERSAVSGRSCHLLPMTAPITGFDLDPDRPAPEDDEQVRKRLDLTRAVPYEELLECIDIANHAPMGGNLERNRWMIIDDADTKAKIAEYFAAVGRPYLAANSEAPADGRTGKVIDSATYLVDHLHEVPALVLAMRLDRVPDGASTGAYAGYWGSVVPGVWSFQPRPDHAESARPGRRSTSTTKPRSPNCSASRPRSRRCACCLSPTTPATRPRPAPAAPHAKVTYLNRWKAPVD